MVWDLDNCVARDESVSNPETLRWSHALDSGRHWRVETHSLIDNSVKVLQL